jgi:hypothetical protein
LMVPEAIRASMSSASNSYFFIGMVGSGVQPN